ncbi:MAG: TonB-dependent receptor [Pseudomonadota bacterium]|nr:TonB-dependent receptor [Pseudomonadota bacterium]
MKTLNVLHAWRAAAAVALLAGAMSVAAQEEPVPEPGTDESAVQDPTTPEIASPEDSIPVIAVEALREPPPAPTSHTEPGGNTVQLEEIVVTATKREKRLRDIPASISAQSGEDLERRGAQSVADIVKLVPGVNLTSTGDTPARITIRGISGDIGTGSTTGILFGNTSFTDTYVPFMSLDPNPFDLEGVEVLKGPQGTLFGASALNGAVRYVPQRPLIGVRELKWFGQYTSIAEGDQAPTYGGAINLPIGDTAAVRVVGFNRDQPGWVDNTRLGIKDSNDIQQTGLRGMLAWQPGDWNIGLTYAQQTTEIAESAVTDNLDGELVTNDKPRPSFNDTRYDFANLSVSRAFDWVEVTSESSYVQKDGHNFFEATARTLPGTPLILAAQEYFADSRTLSQELRFASPAGWDSRWQWVAGVFAFEQHILQKLQVPLGDPRLPLEVLVPILNLLQSGLGSLFASSGEPNVASSDLDVRVRELALFGEVTRSLFDNWELTLGGRLYRTTSGGTNDQGGLITLATYGRPINTIDNGIVESAFNPKASLAWHATPNIMGYAAVSKGFRVGGIQVGITLPTAQNPAPEMFKSDTIWNYETGIRTQWFDNTLRMDVTGFFARWTEPQTVQSDSGLVVYLDNVGGVDSKGVEAALDWLVPFVEGLRLSASASHSKTVTTEPYAASNGDIVPVGTAWPLAPEWQTAATASYIRTLGNWNIATQITHTYLGETTAEIVKQRPVFGYQQWDAQISLSNLATTWLPQVALIVSNIGDERGITNHFSSDLPTPQTTAVEAYYIQPRAITLRLMGRFGD